MNIIGRSLVLAALTLTPATVLAATATPMSYPSAVQQLQKRMQTMLSDVHHHNEQAEVSLEPDASGLKTIVRVRVHPSNAGRFRADLTKKVNEYIEIHKGDCKVNTAMRGMNAFALNPIRNGTSTTYVSIPFSTLAGHGNNVTTYMGDGTVVNCGAI